MGIHSYSWRDLDLLIWLQQKNSIHCRKREKKKALTCWFRENKESRKNVKINSDYYQKWNLIQIFKKEIPSLYSNDLYSPILIRLQAIPLNLLPYFFWKKLEMKHYRGNKSYCWGIIMRYIYSKNLANYFKKNYEFVNITVKLLY